MKLPNKLTIIFLTVACLPFLLNARFIRAQERERDVWQQPVAIMDSIGVTERMIVGEAGAGDGYLTFWLSERVGKDGKVYANDISESALKTIERRCKHDNIKNIITILGKEDDPLFPSKQLDLIVMLIAFHDFKNKAAWLENAKKYLKPNSPLVIIERDPDKWGQGHGHFMTRDEILKTVATASYDLIAIKTFLARDNIFIYRVRTDTLKMNKK